MFNSHLVKVIVGFCGMILLGLISLTIIDSLQQKDQQPNASVPTATTLPPVKTVCCNYNTHSTAKVKN